MPESEPQEASNPTRQWLDQFRGDHALQLSRAKQAADTTGTPGWTANYKTQRIAHEQTESRCIAAIANTIQGMRLNGTDEDSEKAIKEAVKELGEERIRYRAWQSRAVENYRKSATSLTEFVEDIRRKARERERDQPLIDRGFEAEVRDQLRTWITASWDDDTGTVTLN